MSGGQETGVPLPTSGLLATCWRSHAVIESPDDSDKEPKIKTFPKTNPFKKDFIPEKYTSSRLKRGPLTAISYPLDEAEMLRVNKLPAHFQGVHPVCTCQVWALLYEPMVIFKCLRKAMNKLTPAMVAALIAAHYPSERRDLPLKVPANSDSTALSTICYQFRAFQLRVKLFELFT